MAKIPVFVVHGFLESGKTRFVQETLADDYFSGGERNLVIGSWHRSSRLWMQPPSMYI